MTIYDHWNGGFTWIYPIFLEKKWSKSSRGSSSPVEGPGFQVRGPDAALGPGMSPRAAAEVDVRTAAAIDASADMERWELGCF